MIMMASKGHFFTQMPQPMQSSSEIQASLEEAETSMQSFPAEEREGWKQRGGEKRQGSENLSLFLFLYAYFSSSSLSLSFSFSFYLLTDFDDGAALLALLAALFGLAPGFFLEGRRKNKRSGLRVLSAPCERESRFRSTKPLPATPEREETSPCLPLCLPGSSSLEPLTHLSADTMATRVSTSSLSRLEREALGGILEEKREERLKQRRRFFDLLLPLPFAERGERRCCCCCCCSR